MDARHLLVPAGKSSGCANEAVCRMFLEPPVPPRKRPRAARKALPEVRNHRYESATNDAGHPAIASVETGVLR